MIPPQKKKKKKTMERAQNAGNDASEQETQNTMRSVFEIGEGSRVRAKGFEDALYIDMWQLFKNPAHYWMLQFPKLSMIGSTLPKVVGDSPDRFNNN